jgi:DUF1365 family protein
MQYFSPKLFIGDVYHKRFGPKVHDFKYRSCFIKISLLNLNAARNIFFSINRFNLFSFNNCDHGTRDGSSLIEYANNTLAANDIKIKFDDIVMHTYPRILGFVFNPVSFWYFYNNGQVVCTFAEVNNTFGESKTYIILNDQTNSKKEMQVSPFNKIEGEYQFNFYTKDDFEKVQIKYLISTKLIIYASISGIEVPFTGISFLKTFIKCPYYNLGAFFLIHYEAIKLFIKKIPFYGKNGEIK